MPIAPVYADRLASLGTLAASIVHEIRQPIGAIVLETCAMQRWLHREQPNLEEMSEGLHRVQLLTERVERIILSLHALLTQERAQASQFLLCEAVREVIPLVQARIHEDGAVLELDIAPTLPPFRGDRVQLQQVVSNLLINALDALKGMPAGTAEIHLQLYQDGQNLCMEVYDNGKDFPPFDPSELFEPFVSTKAGGMGMGLAICRMIVEAHGGTIEAATAHGRKSVNVRLPHGALCDEGAASPL